ncbi:MAG: DUF5780 domain-containing protein [Oscillospiraceae bacterium]|nr:DUF5780 domain-containing protein [Oscillospiraceae bacterium]
MNKIICVSFCVIIILILGGCGGNSKVGNVFQRQTAEDLIWELVKIEVADNLRQPDTAEFEDISRVRFFQITDDTYDVLGIVRGQNALGNMVSNNFAATVILNADGMPTIVSNVDILGERAFEERANLNQQMVSRLERGQAFLTVEELDEAIRQQPLFVDSTNFLPSSHFRIGRDSMIQAILYNNSDVPIRNAVVGFVAWDRNRLPIRIRQRIGISDGNYFSRLNLDTINLMPGTFYRGRVGDTYYGMRIDENLDVSFLKAIVISYEDFDGNHWTNPLLLDFINLYEEKRLVD